MSFFKKLDLLLALALYIQGHIIFSQEVTLDNNIGEFLTVSPGTFHCNDGNNWGRTFTLSDFGVPQDKELVVKAAEIAFLLATYNNEANLIRFNIYEIDNNFPASFPQARLLGSSQDIELTDPAGPWRVGTWQNLTFNFDVPVVVPANVERILVEVEEMITRPNTLNIAYTPEESDSSWFHPLGICPPFRYVTTDDYGFPFAHYYLKAYGELQDPQEPVIKYTQNCSDPTVGFELFGGDPVASVTWDFGDTAAGAGNTSMDMVPSHRFTSSGPFTVSAEVVTTAGSVFNINTSVAVPDTIRVHAVEDLLNCEDVRGSGIASSFDTSAIQSTVMGGQTGVTVSYFDGHGNSLPSPLPNPMTNSIAGRETIVARVSDSNDPGCYAETSFDLIVNPLPVAHALQDIVVCDNNGIAEFDTSSVEGTVVGHQTGMEVSYLDAQGSTLPNPLPNPYTNTTPYQEIITVQVTNSLTGCMAETFLTLRTSDTLDIPSLPDVYACDEGSGYAQFDVSSIETQIIDSLTGLNVSYLNTDGQVLQDFPSTSYRNQDSYSQTVTVRVADDANPHCYAETTFDLIVNPAPMAYILPDLVVCGSDGFAEFDTSVVEDMVVGDQIGMEVSYFDAQGFSLPDPLSNSYTNTLPDLETITVQVLDPNTGCYTQTSLNLVVAQPPVIDLQETYYLCDLEPSITITTNSDADTWTWMSSDGNIRSTSPEVTLTEEGEYSLLLGSTQNGISCESTASFQLVRTVPPVIRGLETGENFSDDNYISVIASGSGDLEYSLDGERYQRENLFRRLSGGVYTVYVRNRHGCGDDSMETILMDYPRYFTPNGDGINDYWQIAAIKDISGAQIQIFDRYGKLIWEIRSNDMGWDGTYGGRPMPASDYWFALDFGDGKEYKNHFTLKR
ncbi:MAG: T9SS type B sorting domain-containing protein [Bacteroidota bacterium]